MNWHCLTLAAIVTIVGCAADQGSVTAQSVAEMQPTTVRSQQPDNDTSGPGGRRGPRRDAGGKPTPYENPPEAVATLDTPQVPLKIEGEIAAKARAIVNGEPILDAELRQVTLQALIMTERLPEPERSARRKEIVRTELEKLIEREIILSDALARLGKRAGAIDKLKEAAGKEFDKQVRSMKERARQQGFKCDTEEDFAALLESQGMSVDAMRRQSERSFMAMEYMRHRIFTTIERLGHKDIRQYYEEHPGEFQSEDRVKWQDIFIAIPKYPSPTEARKRAEEIAARAAKGEDFIALGKQYDDGDSSIYRQGAGLGSKRGEIRPPEVEEMLFRMREGDIGPVVETFNGFHIIKLVDREYAGLHPFDEKTQSDIKKKLQSLIADREYKRLVEELKRKSTVQIFDE